MIMQMGGRVGDDSVRRDGPVAMYVGVNRQRASGLDRGDMKNQRRNSNGIATQWIPERIPRLGRRGVTEPKWSSKQLDG